MGNWEVAATTKYRPGALVFRVGQKCSGSNCLAAIRRLVPDETVRSKLLYQNASRLLKINLA